MLPSIEQRLSLELAARPEQVAAAIALLDEGATVPFIARYRKEATGGLDDTQLRLLEERLSYLRELEERRAAIITAIEEQGKMTPELLASLMHAEDKTRLEDLYLPFKKKRRTKAQIALEAGLQPLADALLADPTLQPEEEAAKYLKPAFKTDQGDNPGVEDIKAALEGARQILMERFAEDATLLQWLREYLLSAWRGGSRRSPRARKRRARSTPIISTTPSRSIPFPLIGRWRCCGAAARECSTSRCGWILKPRSPSGTRRTIPARRTLPRISASVTETARLTPG